MPIPEPIPEQALNDQSHELFFDNSHPLSNVYPCNIEIDGVVYPSAEHAYHCSKFVDPNIVREILRQKDPIDAKYLAHKNSSYLRDDWDSIKLKVMVKIIEAKLAQNPEVRTILMNTGNKILIEESPDDSNWGMIWTQDNTLEGRNWAGRILMTRRQKLYRQENM